MAERCALGLAGLLSVAIVGGLPRIPFAAEPSAKTRDYVQTALEYELRGENDRRGVMLAAALENTPHDAPANWHSARVQRDGRWMPVAEAQRLAEADPLLAQYRELRQRAGGDVDRQLALARWCARQGLADLSQLHYAHVAQHPRADAKVQEEALKKLNLRNVGGALLTEEQSRAQREAAEQIERALKKWRPQLEEWRRDVESGHPKQRDLAAAQLEQIDDPHIIAVSETFLAQSGPEFGERLVALVGRFDQHEATETLVRFAVLSPWPNVRRAAIAQLKGRPLHDFAPMLLEGLTAPVESRWSVTRLPNGAIQYQHLYYRAGQHENYAAAREHVAVPSARVVGSEVRPGPEQANGLRLAGVRRANDPDVADQRAAAAALATAVSREQAVERENVRIQANNERVFEVLEAVTQAILPRAAEPWWGWWEQYNENAPSKPTRYVYLPTASSIDYGYVAEYVPVRIPPPTGRGRSCFLPGTKVWTERGIAAIETIQPGDRVLSQDPHTGELAYKLVVHTTAGKPTAALARLVVEGEEIFPTLGHVIWVNGAGWRIAKRLQPGDWLHGVQGALIVDEVVERPAPAVVHNLVVADFHTFFVGECGLMVHDITYRQPTRAIVPGLSRQESDAASE